MSYKLSVINWGLVFYRDVVVVLEFVLEDIIFLEILGLEKRIVKEIWYEIMFLIFGKVFFCGI